ncbi:hypothetical protein L1887_24084 [Cichorium endivia]|nr:hypothetical protein L1887_24084 [Cichorium endivia]
MNEFMAISEQKTQANSKAIAKMERQIPQLAEDQRKRDNDKLPSNTEVNLNHTQRVRKEHVNAVDNCTPQKVWRKVTMKDLVGAPSEPSINQPLWNELNDAPEDSRILKEICKEKEKLKVPTPEKVRLTVKASEALLETLPKKENDPARYRHCRHGIRESGGRTGINLGTSILSNSGAFMDCMTGDLDITFGTRKRRLNMFGCPMTLPLGYESQYLNNRPLMTPIMEGRSRKNENRDNDGEDEEILWKAKAHPLASVDKLQLLGMIQIMEKRHQAYAKDARNTESKVFQILDAQKQWINQVSDMMTQLTTLMATIVHDIAPEIGKFVSKKG